MNDMTHGAAVNQEQLRSGPSLNRMRRREALTFYLLISPWVLGFLGFILGPMLMSLYLSLTSYDLFSSPSFVGLQNYRTMFSGDPLFWQSLRNTLFMVLVDLPLGLILSLLAALLLNRAIHGINIFRTIFYLPVLVPAVAGTMLWIWIFDPQIGVLNYVLQPLHIPAQSWLTSESLVKPSIVLMNLFGLGASMVIYLAGLQGIPQQMYEAANIDGAGSLRRFWAVTLPMLSPTILFQVVLGIINELQIFTPAYVIGQSCGTQGCPNNATLFYQLYLFLNAFRYYKMGYASAMAWLLFAITMVLTLLVFRSSSYWVYYEAEERR
jgi:multiple sugar transport system permease protein